MVKITVIAGHWESELEIFNVLQNIGVKIGGSKNRNLIFFLSTVPNARYIIVYYESDKIIAREI